MCTLDLVASKMTAHTRATNSVRLETVSGINPHKFGWRTSPCGNTWCLNAQGLRVRALPTLQSCTCTVYIKILSTTSSDTALYPVHLVHAQSRLNSLLSANPLPSDFELQQYQKLITRGGSHAKFSKMQMNKSPLIYHKRWNHCNTALYPPLAVALLRNSFPAFPCATLCDWASSGISIAHSAPGVHPPACSCVISSSTPVQRNTPSSFICNTTTDDSHQWYSQPLKLTISFFSWLKATHGLPRHCKFACLTHDRILSLSFKSYVWRHHTCCPGGAGPREVSHHRSILKCD